jgi:hypothetical protein
MNGNYLMFMGTRGRSNRRGEKRIKIKCVTLQSLVHNSCNARHVVHLQVDHTQKIEVDEID